MAEGNVLLQGEASPISDALLSASVTVESGEKTKKVASLPVFHTLAGRNNEKLQKKQTELSEHAELGKSSPHERIALSLRRIESVHKRLERVLERNDLRSPFAERMFAFATREIQSAISASNELSGIVDSIDEAGLKAPLNAREVAKMRRMREEVETMVAEFVAVDQSKKSPVLKERMKLKLLEKYGLPKWIGKKKNGGISAYDFLMAHYGRWVQAGVIFKAEVRRMDSQLVANVGSDHHSYKLPDPLLTQTKRSELLATGLFGAGKQKAAAANLHRRTVRRARLDKKG